MYYVNFTIDLCPEKTSGLPEVDGKLYHMIDIDYYMACFISYPLSALGHDISPRADWLKG